MQISSQTERHTEMDYLHSPSDVCKNEPKLKHFLGSIPICNVNNQTPNIDARQLVISIRKRVCVSPAT